MNPKPACSQFRLRADAMMNVVGLGTGVAFLLALFHDKLNVPEAWLKQADVLLAMCVAMFALKLMLAMIVLRDEIRSYLPELEDQWRSRSSIKQCVGVIFLCALIAFGIHLVDISEATSLKSAFVLGLFLIVAALEMLLLTIKNLARSRISR